MCLVTEVPSLANLVQLCFRHPDYFQAGSLHNHIDFWEDLLTSTDSRSQVDWLRIIREGVGVHDFFHHLRDILRVNFMTLLSHQSPAVSRMLPRVIILATSLTLPFWHGFLRAKSEFMVWPVRVPLYVWFFS